MFGPFEQRLQHQAQFEPRQMRARTKMLALAESDMLVGSPPNVEGIRICENLFIAIGRGEPQHHAVSLMNLLAAQLSIFHRHSRKMGDRTRPSENLLDRGRQQRFVLQQHFQLRRMLD